MQVAWIGRHLVALTAWLAILIVFPWLWNAMEYVHTISMLSLVSAGSATLYYLLTAQEKINANHLVIVIGCDSGLGYSLALHCRDLGATVMAGVLEIGSKAAENLLRSGVVVHPLDVTSNKSIKQFGEQVRIMLRNHNLVLRALVNNAAVMVFGEFEWQTEDQMHNQIGVNLLGTMKITRELMPIIRKNASRIIVVSSHCAKESLPGLSIYGATKAAIYAWATSLRVEVQKYGVKVISFVPGSFIQESNIMARQKQHFERMEKSMSEEAKNFYGDYFTRYAQYFSSVSHKGDPARLINPDIYKAFNGAILDVYSSAIYSCEPWRYSFYFTLFDNTPVWIRDRLVQRFMRAPSW